MLIYDFTRCLRIRCTIVHSSKVFYSRRNNSKHEKCYKIVGKVENYSRKNRNALTPIPNWELLKPRGYRFFMPGSVGPAWYDAYTTGYNLPQDFDLEDTNLQCNAQECPVLLRSVVNELFPGIDLSFSQLTIISLSQKEFNSEDVKGPGRKEVVTKKFVLTAQDVCRKLKSSGYWADFINPFSGLPCINIYGNANLYRVDPRFRCLGFQIVERKNCRVIHGNRSKHFIGSLFTSAPPDANVLRGILLPYD